MNIEVVTWRGAFHRIVNKKDPATDLFYLFESLILREIKFLKRFLRVFCIVI